MQRSLSRSGAEQGDRWAAVNVEADFAYTVCYVIQSLPAGLLVMPNKPKKGCNYAGCPNLIESGMYCTEHQRQAPIDQTRGTAAQRGYDATWQRLRVMFLSRHPLCCDPFGVHQRVGAVVPATDVDHILPKAQGGANSYDNLQSLCHSCHSRKTVMQTNFGRGRGGRKSTGSAY